MKIAVITSFKECCTEEDFLIAKAFAEDGHKVDLLDFPLNNKFEDIYDLLIFKNAWDLNEDTYKDCLEQFDLFLNRVRLSKIKIVNSLDGKLQFDRLGKKVLVDLYKEGFNVVPTIDNMEDLVLLPEVDTYIKKPYMSYDGFDMVEVKRKDLDGLVLKKEVLQPKMKFKGEVQMYFVNDEFQYALEYTPSKWPDYPTPHEITPDKAKIEEGRKLVRKNGASCSFTRVDFLRLEDDSLMVLEFADSNPNMSLPMLSEKSKNKFLKNFKKAVYEYYSTKEKSASCDKGVLKEDEGEISK